MDAIRSRVELEARLEELELQLEQANDREEALEVKLDNAEAVIEQLRLQVELFRPQKEAEQPIPQENGQPAPKMACFACGDGNTPL